MDKTGVDYFLITGPSGSLTISADDEVARKLAMLIEGKCLGLGPTKAAEKYGYTKQRFFQLLAAFEQDGSVALMSKKKGPKTNYVRTENVVSQVIRHRFLDPDANAVVIAQKMKQTGIKVSQRSVERIIAEHGLQKKSSTSSVLKTSRKRLKSSIPKNERKR
jgi:transposase